MANLRYRRVKSPSRETPACRSASPTAELALLHTLAAPIDANRRPEFMGAVATKLEAAGPAAVGPGALHRTARTVLRDFWDPPPDLRSGRVGPRG
jgi:hypothetical protein